MADSTPTSQSSSPEDRAESLLSLSIELIDTALDILAEHLDADSQLTRESVLMPGGTVIETFQAFLLPLSRPPSSPALPEINYDKILPTTRKPLARNLPATRTAFTTIRSDLGTWAAQSRARPDGGLAEEMEREVRVVALTPTRQEVTSTLGRELWFCSLHAIHHFSMLRTIAVHELGLELPVEFGTAPSTLLYRSSKYKPPAEKPGAETVKSKL